MAKEAPKANVPAVPDAAAEAPKKRGKLKKIVILLVCLLIILGAGGGGAYWWFFKRVPPSPAGGSAPVAANAPASGGASHGKDNSPRMERMTDLPRSSGMVLPLPQFTVNLADASGRRYLKLGMEVEAGGDISKELQAQDAKIRDAVITLLAGKSFAEISSPEGKVLLKAEVAARLNQILGAPKIIRVYFTDFFIE